MHRLGGTVGVEPTGSGVKVAVSLPDEDGPRLDKGDPTLAAKDHDL